MAKSNKQIFDSTMTIDLLTFFALALVAGVFVLGYSHAYGYYRAFGIDLREAGLDYHTYVIRGLGLMSNLRVLGLGVISAIISAVLLASTHRSRWAFLCIAAFLFLLLGSGATYLGSSLGSQDSEEITFAGKGRTAYCTLRQGADLSQGFRNDFTKFTREHMMRLILRTSDITYLAPRLTENRRPGGFRGQSISLHNDDIAYCRVLGVPASVGTGQ